MNVLAKVFLHIILRIACSIANQDSNNSTEPFSPEWVFFRFYGNDVGEYEDFPLFSTSDMGKSFFDPEKLTIFYVHGYTESANSTSVLTMASAYINVYADINVVTIDWSNYSQPDYFTNAVPNSKKLSPFVAHAIEVLIEQGLELEKIHLIGHSLGAHFAGFVGQELQKKDMQLLRVTGLDPANPGFYPPVIGRLDKTSGKFVDSVITDSGRFGALTSTGHASFWVNGGRMQPGCPPVAKNTEEEFCSHQRSWRYWAEAVYFPYNFIAGNITGFEVYMGPLADGEITSGDYFLITNAEPPYGRGSKNNTAHASTSEN